MYILSLISLGDNSNIKDNIDLISLEIKNYLGVA